MLDANKKYKTRSGLPARVLATDVLEKTYNVAVAVKISEEREVIEQYTLDGKYFDDEEDYEFDLIEVKEPRNGKLTVYLIEEADGSHRIVTSTYYIGRLLAQKEITLTEGEGLTP